MLVAEDVEIKTSLIVSGSYHLESAVVVIITLSETTNMILLMLAAGCGEEASQPLSNFSLIFLNYAFFRS